MTALRDMAAMTSLDVIIILVSIVSHEEEHERQDVIEGHDPMTSLGDITTNVPVFEHEEERERHDVIKGHAAVTSIGDIALLVPVIEHEEEREGHDGQRQREEVEEGAVERPRHRLPRHHLRDVTRPRAAAAHGSPGQRPDLGAAICQGVRDEPALDLLGRVFAGARGWRDLSGHGRVIVGLRSYSILNLFFMLE